MRAARMAGGAHLEKASSSIGRAAVSKTAGWGFKSLLACRKAQMADFADSSDFADFPIKAVSENPASLLLHAILPGSHPHETFRE